MYFLMKEFLVELTIMDKIINLYLKIHKLIKYADI